MNISYRGSHDKLLFRINNFVKTALRLDNFAVYRGARNGTDCNWKIIQASIGESTRQVSALRLCNTFWNGQVNDSFKKIPPNSTPRA